MKVNDSTLQNILKAYGREMKPERSKTKLPKETLQDKTDFQKNLKAEDLDIINYDKDGTLSVDNQKKDALIDFFQ